MYWNGYGKQQVLVLLDLKKVKEGYKPQWRWRAAHRDALKVCKWLWPYAQTKLHKIEQIIDHYEPDIQGLGDNVVELDTYRK